MFVCFFLFFDDAGVRGFSPTNPMGLCSPPFNTNRVTTRSNSLEVGPKGIRCHGDSNACLFLYYPFFVKVLGNLMICICNECELELGRCIKIVMKLLLFDGCYCDCW